MPLLPTDLLVVNRGGKDYKITAKDIYDYAQQYPWQDHEGGKFHVIVSNPDDIWVDFRDTGVKHIVDLSNSRKVDAITKAGEYMILTDPVTRQLFRWSEGSWENGPLTDTSQVTSLYACFDECRKFNSDLSNWDVSNVDDFSSCFADCTIFDQDLSSWDTSSAESMQSMFLNCAAFNHDLGHFDTSNVTEMYHMFNGATSFDQDLSVWCVPKIPSEQNGFATNGCPLTEAQKPCWGLCGCPEPPPWADEVGIYHVIVSNPDDIAPYDHTKILDLSTNNEVSEISKAGEFIVFGDGTKFWMSEGNWTFGNFTDTSKVTNMDRLFYNCVKFNSDISNWDTSKVTNMNCMFGKAIEFNQDISGWNVSNVTNMAGMFGANLQESDAWYVGMTIFNKDISNWNVSNVTNMSGMFRENSAFNQDISKWDMTKAEPWPNEEQGTDVRWMFQNATAFNKNLAGWDMSNQTNLYYLFDGASSFNQDIGNWDTSKVHNMDGMFKNAVEFNQDLSLWCVEDANRNDSPPSHYRFDMGATKFEGKNKPVWGTCPRGENA